MRMPKRGEKGFTLIELLIVVAILGVLAAVIVPNVGRFLGRGEEEARRTEYHNMSTAITAMMVDNSLPLIPDAIAYTLPAGAATNAVNTLTAFPDVTATLADKGANAAFVTAAIAAGDITAEVLGYLLYGNQMVTDIDGDGTYDAGDAITTANYVTFSTTTYFYTCETDGTVRQWSSADTSVAANEYKY